MNWGTQSRNINSQYGGGKQPINISRSDRGQNNRPSNLTNDDPRENEGCSRVLDNSNQYQDDRGNQMQITATTDTPMIQPWVGNKTEHQTAQNLDKIKAFMSFVANNLLLL